MVMSESEIRTLLAQAKSMGDLTGRLGYCEGYIRGLSRFYNGPRSETINEHEKWLGFVYDYTDVTNADRGLGYMDGLQGIRPRIRVV